MRGDDGFDSFDWATWGADDQDEAPSADGPTELGANGHHAAPGRDTDADTEADEAPSAGWVAAGGVLHWEEPDETATDPRAEADSPLAADDLDLPEGAPDAPRVHAVHAWLLRQRARQQDALGALLLARREQHIEPDEPPARRPRRHAEPAAAPLDLAITEHEAAINEYDTLLAALEDQTAHAGPGHTLVEYYLWLTEHLAALAAAPEAASGDAAPATLAAARWRGAALASLAARGRVERMTAPSADED
jgi:hypothetical protein